MHDALRAEILNTIEIKKPHISAIQPPLLKEILY